MKNEMEETCKNCWKNYKYVFLKLLQKISNVFPKIEYFLKLLQKKFTLHCLKVLSLSKTQLRLVSQFWTGNVQNKNFQAVRPKMIHRISNFRENCNVLNKFFQFKKILESVWRKILICFY